MQTLDWVYERLHELLDKKLERQNERLEWLRKRLLQQHPITVLQRLQQKLDDIDQRIRLAWRFKAQSLNNQYRQLNARLLNASPRILINRNQHAINMHWQRAKHLMRSSLEKQKSRLANSARTMHALSPLQTLERGYSITSDGSGHALKDADKISIGEEILTRLNKGRLISRVEKKLK